MKRFSKSNLKTGSKVMKRLFWKPQNVE